MTWEELEATIVYLSCKCMVLEKNLNDAKKAEDYWYQQYQKAIAEAEKVLA